MSPARTRDSFHANAPISLEGQAMLAADLLQNAKAEDYDAFITHRLHLKQELGTKTSEVKMQMTISVFLS
jgi:hypothetical protein